MINFQDYLTNKVDRAAAECDITVYQAAELSDCGWWIFKDNNDMTRAKLYYFFDADYCSVREGRGVFTTAIKCHYGNDVEEKNLVEYVQGLLQKEQGLEERLADATQRSRALQGEKTQKGFKDLGI